MDRRPLAAGVSLWADRGGFTHYDDGQQQLLADGTDEVCFIVTETDGTVAVAKRERDQPPVWLMSSTDVDAVGRFLCVELGPAVRNTEGMQPLLVSFGTELHEGWRIDQEQDRLLVVSPDGAPAAAFALEDPFGVSRSLAFTQYAGASWEDLFSLLTISVEPGDPGAP